MQNSQSAKPDNNFNNVIKINEAQIQNHLSQMVRNTVEETLNAMLDAEADQLWKNSPITLCEAWNEPEKADK